MKSTAEALNGESPRVHVITADSSLNPLKHNKNGGEDVCLTPGCVHAASKMLEQMDQAVEPCDDFYDFACGRYVEDTVIPDDKVSVNAFSVISDKLQEQLRTIITSPVDDSEIEPFKMVKKLYLACMNKSKSKIKISLHRLEYLFKNILSFDRGTWIVASFGHSQISGRLACS